MGLSNDWWHTEYAYGDISGKMGGYEGRQGPDHPSHQWFSEYIPEGSSLLDVGCCNAHTLESTNRLGKTIQYTGVDQLQEFVEWDKECFPGVPFFVSDASDLRQFEDNSFDYVLSRHVMEHLNHYSQHFMEMYRVARKEVVVVGFLDLKPEYDRLQYGMESHGGSWYNQYGRKQMEQFIEYNLTTDYEIIPDKFDLGHPIVIIKKGLKNAN